MAAHAKTGLGGHAFLLAQAYCGRGVRRSSPEARRGLHDRRRGSGLERRRGALDAQAEKAVRRDDARRRAGAMRRLLLALLCACSALFASAGGVAMARSDTVSIACDHFPPNAFDPSRDFRAGYDVENMVAAFKTVGVRVRTAFHPWKRNLEMVRQGKLDGLCVCSFQQARTKWLLYSDEYGRTEAGVFVRKTYDGPEIESFSDLASLRLGVVRGYNLEDELNAAGAAIALHLHNEEAGFRMLHHSRLDAFLGYRSVGQFYMSENDVDPPFRFFGLQAAPYSLCIRRSHPDAESLVRRFNEGLANIRKSGAYDVNKSKY